MLQCRCWRVCSTSGGVCSKALAAYIHLHVMAMPIAAKAWCMVTWCGRTCRQDCDLHALPRLQCQACMSHLGSIRQHLHSATRRRFTSSGSQPGMSAD